MRRSFKEQVITVKLWEITPSEMFLHNDTVWIFMENRNDRRVCLNLNTGQVLLLLRQLNVRRVDGYFYEVEELQPQPSPQETFDNLDEGEFFRYTSGGDLMMKIKEVKSCSSCNVRINAVNIREGEGTKVFDSMPVVVLSSAQFTYRIY
jgi:hypothetical protein